MTRSRLCPGRTCAPALPGRTCVPVGPVSPSDLCPRRTCVQALITTRQNFYRLPLDEGTIVPYNGVVNHPLGPVTPDRICDPRSDL
jgi:hypothetical protein